MATPASKLKLRSGEMILVAETAEDIVALLRAGEPVLSLLRADGYGNVVHLTPSALDYVEDIAPS